MGGGKGGSCKKYTVGYKYSVGMHLVLCHSDINAIYAIYAGEEYSLWKGIAEDNETITIDAAEIFGGSESEGGVTGDVDILFGASDQAANTYLAGQLGTVPAFRGVVSLVLNQTYLGTNPYIKPWWTFLSYVDTGWYPEKSKIGLDLNPIHIIRECQTDTIWGLGYSAADIDSTSYESAADTLYSENFGLSLIWDESTDIEGFIQEILRHIEGVLFIEPSTGKWVIKLIRQDYDAETLEVFDSDIILEMESYSRRSQSELANTVILTYLENQSQITPSEDVPFGVTELTALAGSPSSTQSMASTSSGILFRSSDSGHVHKSTDFGSSWTDLGSITGGGDIQRIYADTSDNLWVEDGDADHIYVSPDQGATWADRTIPTTPQLWAYAMGEDSIGGIYIGCSAGRIYKTNDLGNNWTPLPVVPSGNTVYCLVIADDDSISCGCGSTIFRKEPAASTWTAIFSGPTGTSHLQGMFKTSDGRLWVTILYSSYGTRTTSSLYYSDDHGVSWYSAELIITERELPAWGEYSDGTLLILTESHNYIMTAYRTQIPALSWTADGIIDVPSVSANRGPLFNFAMDSSRVRAFISMRNYVGAPAYEITPSHTIPEEITVGLDIEKSITAHNIGLINAMGGEIVAYEVNMPGISQPDLANSVAARELANQSTELSATTFTTNRSVSSYRVGDVFKLSWPEYGVTEEIMRITEIDFGTLADGKLRISAAQDISGVGVSIYAAAPQTAWVSPAIEPEDLIYQRVDEATYWDWTREIGESEAAWAEVSADSGLAFHSGVSNAGAYIDYTLWTHPEGGSYEERTSGAFTPTALLDGDIGKTDTEIAYASPQDIDEVSVDTYAHLDDEIILISGIDTETLTLTIARGILDTVPAEHSDGARIWFSYQWAFSDSYEYFDGETAYIKALPRTSKGSLSIGDATELTLVFDSRMIRPYPPGNFLIDGETYPETTEDGGSALNVTWAHRDRLQQTAYFVEQDEADIGPEAGTTYTVLVEDTYDPQTVYTESGISGTEYDDTDGTDTTDSDYAPAYIRVTLNSQRDGYDSWQSHSHEFIRIGYGFVYNDGEDNPDYGGFN